MKVAVAICRLPQHGALAVLLGLAVPAAAQSPAGAWAVADAPLRFELRVSRTPTHPSAGFFVELPDGGLLPGPAPVTRVFTSAGAPVESYTLWHNPGGSLAIIVAADGSANRLTVYVQPASRYRLWDADSGLTPSAILAADPTQASLAAAGALARLGRTAVPTAHFINKAGIPSAPLSVGGDETGRPRPASFYMLAYVISADPGKTWVAPFTLDGSGEVRINGVVLSPQRRIDKWGGIGDWADIRPGLNRVEILHAAPGGKPFFTKEGGGLVYLTWRTPNASMGELGGVRSEALPMAGTSRMETRLIKDSEIVRSGACELTAAQAQDGRPVALIRRSEPKTFWFENETPLLVGTFEAMAPADSAHYSWTFQDGAVVKGPKAEWILPGFQEHKVRLEAASPAGGTSAICSFYGFSTRRTSLDSADDRRDFRSALWKMAEAYPAGHAAVTNWNPAVWRTLLQTTEFGKGTPLLRTLFNKHFGALEKNVTADEFEALQDVFLEVSCRLDSAEALEWIKTFSGKTRDQRRRDELVIRAADVYLHYLRDLESADKILRGLVRPELDDGQRLIRVRLGDLALLNGDLNLATRYYAEVQNYSRIRRSVADRKAASETGGRPGGRVVPGAAVGLARSDDWKLRALVDASASEAVRSLLQQGHLLEAREMLRIWERDLPLSKISSDFILLESMLYRAVNDPVRAASMLRAFCETVESSNYLHEAAPLLLHLMLDAGEPPERIRLIGERLKKALEFHPVHSHLDHILRLVPETPKAPAEVENDEA